MIEIKLNYLKTVNYAMCHNGAAVCESFELKNTDIDDVKDFQVTCQGEFLTTYTSAVMNVLPAGKAIKLKDVEIKPNPEKLLSVTESVLTTFTVSVLSNQKVVHQQQFELEIMPFDYWLGTSVLPQHLASFATPNAPAIAELTIKAAKILKEITGSSSFTEYQKGNPDHVAQQVAAIFSALHQEGIVYRALPPSFEEKGQRVTLPAQVLQSKLGNCIELSLLFASVLESVGINSVIIIEKGHAYLGVWLVDDSFAQSFCDDASYLEKKCSKGINEMIVLESTHITDEDASFTEAQKKAERHLAKLENFEMFIDIRRCRLERVRPLPLGTVENGVWTVSEGVQHDSVTVDIKEHDRYDLTRFNQTNRELTKFDIWERKLLDFTLRNSLLNLSLKRRAIQFMSFDVNRIEDHLQDGEEYCLMPKIETNQTKLETDERIFRSKLLEPYHELIRSDIEHKTLHTYQSETESQNILKNIYRAARNAIEETGANSLFLAIGLLRWYENPLSDTPRFAPLLLMPVEMVYKKGRYYIRTNDEGITLNITLIEYLRQVQNIPINGLYPLPEDEHGVDVPLIFAGVRDALKNQKGWDVEEECVLGTFSFSKFLMWNDVHSNREALLRNDIIHSLVENKLTWVPPVLSTSLKEFDSNTPPSAITLPMAADSSQMAAIIEAGKGHSFILYGPPGTGKSQTITNLIANALYQGKRVLFVAEKMAALSVVQKRLAKIGLDPFCLELHSNKSTKRHVLEQLDKSLKVAHIMAPAEYAKVADKIYEQRKEMIGYLEALHQVDAQDGMSLYDCILRYEAIEAETLPQYRHNEQLEALLQRDGVQAVEQLLGGDLETVVQLVGAPAQHPLNGLQLSRENVATKDDLVQLLERSAKVLREAESKRAELERTKDLFTQLMQRNSPEILKQDAHLLDNEWRSAKAKWFIPRFFAKRNFVESLKKYNRYINAHEVDALISNLLKYQSQHQQISQVNSILCDLLDISTEEDIMPAAEIINDAISHMSGWAGHADQIRDWVHWSEYRKKLKSNGLLCIVDELETGGADIPTLRKSFMKALFKHKIEVKSSTPALATFSGLIFDEKVRQYRQLADDFQMLTQKELYARLAAGIPRVTDSIDNSSEIGLLRRNISNGGRGLSLRDLFDQIPTLLPRLCPCMLMSPMSVAQYMNLAGEQVDMVVFDEASQMPTSEAVGAIARGKALVVVGDPKQMPPTSFFSSTNVDEEEAAIDDMESILEDCRTLEIPSLQLNWHYRSKHESLIAFSNNEYYDGELITFPSVDDQHTKVRLVPISGWYDKGNKRTNKSEAEAIVQEIIRRLRDEELRKHSIGVIAFSVVQQGLIEDILQEQLDKDKELKELADSLYEPIFIKNLENVQGDERDIILFSIGYGPDKDGKVSMNFGPLNNAGGERRLNVAVSRARREMMIFSTLKSSQIDLRRTKAKGVEGLKHFLEYAETQSLPSSATATVSNEDGIIARQIANELEKRGYTAKVNIGRSHFKVDVAVCDNANPDIYKLGILLDGNRYRDTQTTRDREIVQPSVLSSLNWNIMRVWSVDWFYNKSRVMDRIVAKIGETPKPAEESKKVKFDISAEEVIVEKSVDHNYEEFTISPSALKSISNAKLVHGIVAKEQPISFMLLCRRYSTLRELGKVTPKLQKDLLAHVEGNYYVEPDREGRVVWLSAADKEGYTGYRIDDKREIADIPMIEIKNAIKDTIAEQVAIQTDNLTLIVAKKLGYTRRGTNVDAAFREALTQLLQEGKIEQIDGKLRFKK